MMRQSGRDPARSWLDVDLGAVRRNAAAVAARAGVPILPMVKADAYGTGAAAVAGALEPLRPWGYGVATVAEGEELRALGIARPIVVFTPLLPADFGPARDARLTPVLGDPSAIASWVEADPAAPWHLGIDSGMARAGIRWDAVGAVLDLVRRSPPEAATTHFHSADVADGSMADQEARFRAAVGALPARPPLLHVENSAAVVRTAGSAWDVVRPGVFLYGVDPVDGAPFAAEPVVALRARVVELRDVGAGESVSYNATYRATAPRRIATVAAGYGDGYRRAFGRGGLAVLDGRAVPVAGLVTMDMTMLDVTDVPCAVGDVATLIGGDDPRLSVGAIARAADVSPYELLVGLRLRLERRYRPALP